jgi:hypothetical protein
MADEPIKRVNNGQFQAGNIIVIRLPENRDATGEASKPPLS